MGVDPPPGGPGAGCAFLDDFSIKQLNLDDFRDPPNPLEVVKNSKDGTKRARAIRCLKEPNLNGGTPEQQDLYVSVLNYTAANDSQALCRMAAVDVLRTYRDGRAVDGLKEAYYRAERRGFTGGDPVQDWLEAEVEIDRMAAAKQTPC